MHSNLKETSRNSNAIAWNHRWWHSETTKEARGETQKKCWLLQKRFKANHNQIPQWASWWNQVVKVKSMILPWQSARLLKNTQSKMPRTQIVVLGYTQCKMPRPWRHTHTQHNAEKKLEHGTPTVALTQSFSSEALQALLLEKCFTNCFAVGLLDLDRKGRVYKWISGYDLLHIIQV